MHTNLFNHIDIKEENVHLPSSLGGDLEKNCKDYSDALNAAVVDMQLLGIGANGHIGFNEPGTSFESETLIVTLKEKTRQDNARFFDGDINQVPTHAITMGIKNIMNAKSVWEKPRQRSKSWQVPKSKKASGILPNYSTGRSPAVKWKSCPDCATVI